MTDATKVEGNGEAAMLSFAKASEAAGRDGRGPSKQRPEMGNWSSEVAEWCSYRTRDRRSIREPLHAKAAILR